MVRGAARRSLLPGAILLFCQASRKVPPCPGSTECYIPFGSSSGPLWLPLRFEVDRIAAAAAPPAAPVLPLHAQLGQEPGRAVHIKRAASFVHRVARRSSWIASHTRTVSEVEARLFSSRTAHASDHEPVRSAEPKESHSVRLYPGLELGKPRTQSASSSGRAGRIFP